MSSPPAGRDRRDAGTATEGSMALLKPALPEAVGVLRRAAVEFAAAHGAESKLQADIALVVSEAATNAVKHAEVDDPGAGAGRGVVELTATVNDDWLEVRVRDRGRDFGAKESDGLGLGLPIIATLAPDLKISQPGHGTEVRMRFPLPRDADAPPAQ
jgi:anti-sigma regulatory factor (Ser/Thr protein kinase)